MEAEKKIVYIITFGSYSDYQICAVTMDKKKAEFYRTLYSSKYEEEAVIEEWPIDGDSTDTDGLMPIYEVSVSFDGRVESCLHHYVDKNLSHVLLMLETDFCLDAGDRPDFHATLTAKDDEHARKIALDRRAYLLAERGLVL